MFHLVNDRQGATNNDSNGFKIVRVRRNCRIILYTIRSKKKKKEKRKKRYADFLIAPLTRLVIISSCLLRKILTN